MSTIAIRLDPSLLENPDTDLRYLLPDLVTAASDGAVVDDGYDYDDDGHLVIYMATSDVDVAIEAVRLVVESQRPLGNDLAQAAVVSVADDDHCDDASRFRIVYPRDSRAERLPRS